MKYGKGDIVEVRLSGLKVNGIIKTIKRQGQYLIQFDGGSEKEVNERFMKLLEKKSDGEILAPKTEKPSKSSPSRQQRSPSRQQRSPSRRSPARKASSPARRGGRASPSPSRKKSSGPTSNTSIPSAKKETSRILKVSLENIGDAVIGDSNIATIITRRRKIGLDTKNASSVSEIINLEKKDSNKTDYSNVHKFEEIPERVIHLKDSETFQTASDLGAFSDDEIQIDENQHKKREKSESKVIVSKYSKEFGGWLGASLLIFLIPISIIFLHIYCNKNVCTFRKIYNIKDEIPGKILFDLKSFGIYSGFIATVALLSRLPYVGKSVVSLPSKEPKYTYNMNGVFTAFTILGMIIAIEFNKRPIANYILNNYFQFLTSATIFGFITSIFVFIRSKFTDISLLNPHGVTYNFIYDFFMGRQINPRIFGFDIKIILLRASYVLTLIINSLYLYKSLNVTLMDNEVFFSRENFRIDLQPAILVATILQILYVFDTLVFEPQLVTSFELQYEGLGYMRIIHYALYPFILTCITKFLVEHGTSDHDNLWILTAISLIYLAGYILYRGSNSQKNAFRLNPYDPALSHLNSIATSKGKKLLISGFWSKLRHPNYAGDILIHLALGALCSGSPAVLCTLPVAFSLAYRAVRDNYRCKQKYGTSWDRYAHKVKYAIIPKIF